MRTSFYLSSTLSAIAPTPETSPDRAAIHQRVRDSTHNHLFHLMQAPGVDHCALAISTCQQPKPQSVARFVKKQAEVTCKGADLSKDGGGCNPPAEHQANAVSDT